MLWRWSIVAESLWMSKRSWDWSQLLIRVLLLKTRWVQFTKDFARIHWLIRHDLILLIVISGVVAAFDFLEIWGKACVLVFLHDMRAVVLNFKHFFWWLSGIVVVAYSSAPSTLRLLHRSFQKDPTQSDWRIGILRLPYVSGTLSLQLFVVVGATSVWAGDLT